VSAARLRQIAITETLTTTRWLIVFAAALSGCTNPSSLPANQWRAQPLETTFEASWEFDEDEVDVMRAAANLWTQATRGSVRITIVHHEAPPAGNYIEPSRRVNLASTTCPDVCRIRIRRMNEVWITGYNSREGFAGAMIHEWGHVLGLDHQAHGIMMNPLVAPLCVDRYALDALYTVRGVTGEPTCMQ
jgi:hypothetical protein